MQRQKIPGVSVAIVAKDGQVVAKGYGLANVEHDVPVTPETIFQSGSLGKQFTSTAVMLQVEDGKLALEDPITKYFPDAPPEWNAIRIRHLLTHTSGIPDYTTDTIDYRHDYTEDELTKLAYGLKLEFEPGSRWNYSNTGLHAARLSSIHRVSGQFYGDVLKERVFGPLGMKTTRIISEEDIVPHRAAGYRLVKGELKNQEWVAPKLNTTADGSLYFSARDLVAWDRGLRTKAILKPESWAQIFTPVKLNSGKTLSRTGSAGPSPRRQRPAAAMARRLVAGLRDVHRALSRRRPHGHRPHEPGGGRSGPLRGRHRGDPRSEARAAAAAADHRQRARDRGTGPGAARFRRERRAHTRRVLLRARRLLSRKPRSTTRTCWRRSAHPAASNCSSARSAATIASRPTSQRSRSSR